MMKPLYTLNVVTTIVEYRRNIMPLVNMLPKGQELTAGAVVLPEERQRQLVCPTAYSEHRPQLYRSTTSPLRLELALVLMDGLRISVPTLL